MNDTFLEENFTQSAGKEGTQPTLFVSYSPDYTFSIGEFELALIDEVRVTNIILGNSDASIRIEFHAIDIEPVILGIDNCGNSTDNSYTVFPSTFRLVNGQLQGLTRNRTIKITASLIVDDDQLAEDTIEVNLIPAITLTVDLAKVYSVVFQQNQFPLISHIDITNNSSSKTGTIKVVADFDPDDFESTTWMIDELSSKQSVRLKERQLRISANALDSLTERRLIQVRISVFINNGLICSKSEEIEFLPKNHWGGELHMPELLSAFVTPNTNYCDLLIKKASNLLSAGGHPSMLDGYQSRTRERPYMVAAALWSVICNEGISYCVPPASFATTGQKVRLCDDISNSLLATCLDTALLFASCLEQAGLNSVIAVTTEHAMVGVWLLDETFLSLTNSDPVDLRNRIALKDLILFETTLVTSDSPIKFTQAIDEASRKISEEAEKDFVYVLDVKQARTRKITPLNLTLTCKTTSQVEATTKVEVTLPPLPSLPSIKPDDISEEDVTPTGRVEQWRRKLLDLSRRNKLLNIKQKSMGFQIKCPNLDVLEDNLAAGKKYNIISPKLSPTSTGRDSSSYTLQTGDDLNIDFAREQFDRGNLIASCSEKELEKNLINLFRKSKLVMDEGGANTLFLAVGMLRWKEDARLEQSYKAPLILLPVKLERRSARSKPKLLQRPDEEAIFNLTLVEFLQKDFEIDLSCFQTVLPKDESGIDVTKIWNTVRSKIKEVPGFEVVEELVLSNFSFSKYLMWKDLSDRIDDLKTSPFVDHLIERPASTYPYDADFIELSSVDKKIDYSKFYAPLNADSSQIVAIDASARGKDFVLEGPPGTGKSETIANIIAHNIALSRKVLFVSEKMAALDVVYQRLRKVGLDHLCLELHSNKVSKKAVIDQLDKAWTFNISQTQDEWDKKADELNELREHLNQYVEELHKKSTFDLSIRDVISRSIRYGSLTKCDLGWKPNLETAPISTSDDIKKLFRVSEIAGLAFKEVENVDTNKFSLIQSFDWSNIWQMNLVTSAKKLNSEIDNFSKILLSFIRNLSPEYSSHLTIDSAKCWGEVARLCKRWVGQATGFAIVDNSKELIAQLDKVAKLKGQFDELTSLNSLDINPELILEIPVKEWVTERERLGDLGCEKFVYENSHILNFLEAKGLPLSFSQPPEVEEKLKLLSQTITSLKSRYDCQLENDTLVETPVESWVDEYDKNDCSLPEKYSYEVTLMTKIIACGFSIETNLSKIRLERVTVVQEKYKKLKVRCSCTLADHEIVRLPVNDWLGRYKNLEKKNFLARYFTKQKIKREMKQQGLKKVKDLGILVHYLELVNTISELQTCVTKTVLDDIGSLVDNTLKEQSLRLDNSIKFYNNYFDIAAELAKFREVYKGDSILDTWNESSDHIIKRKQEGIELRKQLFRAASQLNDPQELVHSTQKLLVDNYEFLESSQFLKNAELLLSEEVVLLENVMQFSELSCSSEFSKIPLNDLQLSLDEIVNSSQDLNAWCRWIEAKNNAMAIGLNNLISTLEEGIVNWDEVKEQTTSALCNWLAPLLIDKSKVLCKFSAMQHGSMIDKFRKLDQEIASTTGYYISAKIASEMPNRKGAKAPEEYGVLSRELQKKTRHKPVRQLVHELGEHLLNLTPCFMMSPLSVAQFLPADYKAFDLVVFDEASQITVWDAVGAIARGKNVIVVGDPKQMPPTNFFNRSQEVDDSDEADLESILDQAMAARAPHHRLTGHYRSKHESLITFSNSQYYQNSLLTYPSAEVKESAVILHRVKGVYAKGASRNNPIEAQAVVREVVRRLKDPRLQKLSIGIVTFNTEQQRLIEDLLDDERRKDTALEQFFSEDMLEPVFVKNLETVQGDQRDVICLSIGYGPTVPEAKTMSMNFGPLNRQGGERRLNVAITRASTEMLLFSSFDASMVDLSRTSSEAVKHLKAYIDYANRGSAAIAQMPEYTSSVDQFDSDFEQVVAFKLREKGWEVRTQVGVSKFRIDAGVINPDQPGSFLAGIECDGATYHSSPSARDRDRVRHIILESLGWSLVRIWSTDFFINPDKVINNVHDSLEALLAKDRKMRKELQEESLLVKVDTTSESEIELETGTSKDYESTEEGCLEEVVHTHESSKTVKICSAPVHTTTVIHPYDTYNGGMMDDPRNVKPQVVGLGLIDIVKSEGPMLVKRAYDIYLRHCGIRRMGKELKTLMNKSLQHVINEKLIVSDDEWRKGDLVYSIIRTPEQQKTKLRQLGGRSLNEIPPSEIDKVSKIVMAKNIYLVFGSDDHLRAILNRFQLNRLTVNSKKNLLEVLGLS